MASLAELPPRNTRLLSSRFGSSTATTTITTTTTTTLTTAVPSTPASPLSPLSPTSPPSNSPKDGQGSGLIPLRIRTRESRSSLPSSRPLNADFRDHSTTTSRPASIRLQRASYAAPLSNRSGRGLGFKLPIAVDSSAARTASSCLSPTRSHNPLIMATPQADPVSPVNASAAETFEDAPENSSNPPDKQENSETAAAEEAVVENGDSAPSQSTEEGVEGTQSKEKIQETPPAQPTHSRTNTQDSVPVLPRPDSVRSRSVSPSKRSSTIGEGQQSPVLVQGPDDSGRMSPTRTPRGAQSPPKLHRGLSGDSTSRPPSANKTASTRIGGFLSRMGSMRKPAKSPPAPGSERGVFDRRNTSQSISSLTSNGEHLATIEDGAEDTNGVKRPSLRDQFLTLRKQGQDAYELNGYTSPPNELKQSETDAPQSPDPSQDAASSAVRPASMDPALPPGTAAGLAAGPAEEPRPVDWDLWQSVVYEGPAAVTRTSGEELDRAIASGIPAAIRGVVWQVLADSKSPELEDLYRTLRDRSVADIEQQQQASRPTMAREDSQVLFQSTDGVEKESEEASSRSSIHSDKSGTATPSNNGQTTPPPAVLADDSEARAKLLAEKAKREAAALTKLEKTIRRDLGSRTSFSKYTQAAGLQDGLFGICKAYALFDEAVGYAQGMNFIAMPLLFNTSEEEAFTLLVRLMSKYEVRTLFADDMAGLHLRLYQFERLLEDNDPALYCHLRRRNVAPQLYATQWFLTLFAYRFPLQLVLRVYDLIFSQGLIAILRFGLVLLQQNREALLEMKDMGQLTSYLKEKLFDVYIDKSPSASSLLEGGFFGSVSGGADKEVYRADELVRDACAVEITETNLAAYTVEWEEQQRLTAELETLRTSNTTLTTRVKALEDRTQQQDLEHVTLAGDLVRVKVENDKLLDENEGLKIKMEELQRMVDTQPAEIEAQFKEEMERVLERNSAVQNENRVLKEEQEEMERQMVDIKMKHAQTQQDHETLSQRWASVQAIFNNS